MLFWNSYRVGLTDNCLCHRLEIAVQIHEFCETRVL